MNDYNKFKNNINNETNSDIDNNNFYINESIFNKNAITHLGNVPVYQQILSLISHNIHSGELKPGEMLPPESKLCEIFGVSRTTIRLALDRLAEENLIIRRRGKGSYVASPRLRRNINHLYSFTQDMKNIGINPHSKVIQSSVIKVPDEIAPKLAIPKNTDVFALVRVRYADEEPILHETTFIPYFLCKGIDNEDFSYCSLYQLLQFKYNLKLAGAIETYEAVKLSKRTSELLNCAYNLPAFKINRIGYLDNEIPFEFTYSFARSDKCMFTVELKTGKSHAYFSRKITL